MPFWFELKLTMNHIENLFFKQHRIASCLKTITGKLFPVTVMIVSKRTKTGIL